MVRRKRQTWTYFTDAMHGMECGVWACEPGMWRICFAANKLEFFVCWKAMSVCMMLMVRVHDVRAGEAGVIPAGFVGRLKCSARCASILWCSRSRYLLDFAIVR